MFELTSYEPFVVTDVEGLFGACCAIVTSKLLQDAILLVEDDLPYCRISFVDRHVDFDNLLVKWEVKTVVEGLAACAASLPVTQSESETQNAVLIPLDLGDG